MKSLKRYFLLLITYLIQFSLCCRPFEYYHTDDSLLIKRLHLDPYSRSETNFIRGDIIFWAELDASEEDNLFPVLQILDRESTKTNIMIRRPYIYTYFLHLIENPFDTSKIKFVLYEHSEKVERQNGPPFRFVTGYNIRIIEEDPSPIMDFKMKEIEEMIQESYNYQKKTVLKVHIEFKTDWIFNWKIYIVNVDFKKEESERFAIVDSLFDPESRKRNLKILPAVDPDFQPKMSISHCLKDTDLSIPKDIYDHV